MHTDTYTKNYITIYTLTCAFQHIHFHWHTCYHESSRTSSRIGWKRDASDQKKDIHMQLRHHSHRTWRVEHSCISVHIHESVLSCDFTPQPNMQHFTESHTGLGNRQYLSTWTSQDSFYKYFSESLSNSELCFVINTFGRKDKIMNSVFISGGLLVSWLCRRQCLKFWT